jgi:hypothetical protein
MNDIPTFLECKHAIHHEAQMQIKRNNEQWQQQWLIRRNEHAIAAIQDSL